MGEKAEIVVMELLMMNGLLVVLRKTFGTLVINAKIISRDMRSDSIPCGCTDQLYRVGITNSTKEATNVLTT
jgi:hypothetical protein